jgi:glycosyltransferase A (GT-A) superfamily protein (DUF2064 family)
MTALVVIAKEPVAGRVKTRLVPPLTYDDAANLAAAALQDTLAALTHHPATQRLLAFDGDPTAWLPDGWRAVAQPAGGLDRRLVSAFDAVKGDAAVLVGMDTPQLRTEQLIDFDPQRYDACLGLAADGGYWAIGFADPRLAGQAIAQVPMSTGHTGAAQQRRFDELGLRVQLLDEMTDVDDIASAQQVAALVPGSRFARALTDCEATV